MVAIDTNYVLLPLVDDPLDPMQVLGALEVLGQLRSREVPTINVGPFKYPLTGFTVYDNRIKIHTPEGTYVPFDLFESSLISLVQTPGGIDGQLDAVYNVIEDMLCEGAFEKVDGRLKDVNLRLTPEEVLIGYLIITLPDKSKLYFRENFAKSVRKYFTEKGDPEVEKIMKGLE